MRSAIVLAVSALVLPAFGQPDTPREWLVVRDTFPEFRGAPDSLAVGRDMAPGTGIFEYCAGPTGYRFPLAAVDVNGGIPVALADADDSVTYFSRVDPWCHWGDPVRIAMPQPEPFCPSYNIAASKVSHNVCITWVYSPDGFSQMPGFYRISTDGGETWGNATQLMWPDAYRGDTLPSFHASSLFPFYDARDDLHVVAAVGPFVNDTNYILPAQIWHWKDETWSLVHRADPELLRAPVGFNTLIAGRPSLGGWPSDPDVLFCVWEEFDGEDVDTVTGLLRADIWAAFSTDGGDNWYEDDSLTGHGGQASYRFPCITDLAVVGSGGDTNMVVYLVDQQAGFACLGQGSATQNPVVARRFVYYRTVTLDTIGGTTQDLQCLGPAVRTLCNSEDYGVHVAWEHSTSQSGGFPDLNVRYNFYDFSIGDWNWNDPDYMRSGVDVFMKRAAFGRLSVDSSMSRAHVSGHYLPLTGMAEQELTASSRQPTASFARDVLWLRPQSGDRPSCGGTVPVLMDIAGRKVMGLRPGANDIRYVAPGIYYVRTAESGTRSAVTRVIVEH